MRLFKHFLQVTLYAVTVWGLVVLVAVGVATYYTRRPIQISTIIDAGTRLAPVFVLFLILRSLQMRRRNLS